MGRVLTNTVSVAYCIETSLGVLPGSPTWKTLEPNAFKFFGNTIKRVARDPISRLRQRRKGTIVDLDSKVDLDVDLTKEHFIDFVEGFMFSNAKYPSSQRPLRSGALYDSLSAVSAGPNYAHSAISLALVAGRLIYARGFSTAGNNGLKVVAGSSSTTSTKVTTPLTNETPTNQANATIELAGVRGASADITLTVVGTVGTLGSTILDFTTLGLNVGQVIHVGGLTSTNQFANGAGYARITSIATNAIGLDKLDSTLLTDTGAGKAIDLLFGAFIRNVQSDDSDFLFRSYQFELALPNLTVPGPGDQYEYAKGNVLGSMTVDLPLTNKALISWGFIGTHTDNPTGSRATNASTPEKPVQTVAFNTSADIARLRVAETDETGISTYFESLQVKFDNNVNPEKALGTLGAVFINYGNFLVDIDATLILTDPAVVTAIRNNRTVSMDWIVKNDDGAIIMDVPNLLLGDGTKSLPVNKSVTIKLMGEAFVHPTLNYTLGISLIPIVP